MTCYYGVFLGKNNLPWKCIHDCFQLAFWGKLACLKCQGRFFLYLESGQCSLHPKQTSNHVQLLLSWFFLTSSISDICHSLGTQKYYTWLCKTCQWIQIKTVIKGIILFFRSVLFFTQVLLAIDAWFLNSFTIHVKRLCRNHLTVVPSSFSFHFTDGVHLSFLWLRMFSSYGCSFVYKSSVVITHRPLLFLLAQVLSSAFTFGLHTAITSLFPWQVCRKFPCFPVPAVSTSHDLYV